MNQKIFHDLFDAGHITETDFKKIRQHEQQPVSLQKDLATLLYVGILLLTTGLGIIIYKNIDSIGHLAIVLAISAATIACFAYCLSKSKGFSTAKVLSPSILFDYLLLAGCLLLLILFAYLQFQFNVFGNRWGLATFLPMLVLFISAYYFDHLGILSMAIVNLCTWVGITVTPLHLLRENDFQQPYIIYSMMGLGAVLYALNILSRQSLVKPHFAFTYKNFGLHLLFIGLLAATTFFNSYYLLWFLLMAATVAYFIYASLNERSVYFLVVCALYFYFEMSYVAVHSIFLPGLEGDSQIYLCLLYLVASAFGLIVFLIRFTKKIKTA